jgi:cholinesterase
MQLLTVLTLLSVPTVWASPHAHPHRRQTANFTVGQTVDTTSGSVTGHAASAYSEVSEYLGIPFGQPPVGNLRFAAPVRYSGSGAINASTFVSSSYSDPSPQLIEYYIG